MEIRINKFLSAAGICSRREADRWISEGRVRIDDELAAAGSKVYDGQSVYVDGKAVNMDKDIVLLAFYKPVGIVCTTTDKQGNNNIVDYIGYPKRVYPVGRLDKDSEGLILMTNQGALMDQILRAANGHEKEYLVTVNKPIDSTFLKKMESGVYLSELQKTTKPCRIQKVNSHMFRLILTQGLNRQIRRMCKELGYRVESLKRIRIMNIQLGDLNKGEYRAVTEDEYRELLSQLSKSM